MVLNRFASSRLMGGGINYNVFVWNISLNIDFHFRFKMPPVIGSDDHRFYRLVTLSNKVAPSVLRKVIKQYCSGNGLTFEDVLDIYKHELFHFWCGATAPCCKCNGRRFNRVLLNEQWDRLFTASVTVNAHTGHDRRVCPEVFSPHAGVDVDVCDVSLASSILTNITGKVITTRVVGLITSSACTVGVNFSGLLEYIIDQVSSRLGVNGFERFLSNHQHELFHFMERNRCCQCTSDPNGRNVITSVEWNKMFVATVAHCTLPVCSQKVQSCTWQSLEPHWRPSSYIRLARL